MASAATEFKTKGNEAFRNDKFKDALALYTSAIEAFPQADDASMGALYSNRSACYAGLEQWQPALEDATECLKRRPDWPKAYYRRALGLIKCWRAVEARGLCQAGLILDPDNKDLKDLKKVCTDPICREFANASSIDFRMDNPPSEDFKLVAKNKIPPPGAQLNDLGFNQTKRTMMHVAVMMQYPKVIKEMLARGGDVLAEDRMGLTPLHMAVLIQHDLVNAALGEWVEKQPESTTHNATPRDILDATSFTVMCPQAKIRVASQDKSVKALDAMDFTRKFKCWYNRTCQLSDDYFRCMFSSVLDDEGQEMMADERKSALTKTFKVSDEEKNLGVAFIDEMMGHGLFALKDYKQGDYVVAYSGQLVDNANIKDQARNSYVLTIMALDKLPYKTDATLYRSLGAFMNHSDTPNTKPEAIVAKGAPMIVFTAAADIKAGDQISFDYRGRLHTVFCDNNLPGFKPLKSLDAATLAALQKL